MERREEGVFGGKEGYESREKAGKMSEGKRERDGEGRRGGWKEG